MEERIRTALEDIKYHLTYIDDEGFDNKKIVKVVNKICDDLIKEVDTRDDVHPDQMVMDL